MNFETKLREYAALLVNQGLNVQPGQTVGIASPVDCAELARLCADYAYAAGAREVLVQWRDDTIERLRYLRAETDVFDVAKPWIKPMFDFFVEHDVPRLAIVGHDPESLKGVDSDRIRRSQRAGHLVTEPYFNAMTANRFPWCVAASPTASWAKHVFPDLPIDAAVEKLWEHVLAAVRVTGDGKSAQRWAEHVASMKDILKKLNDYAFDSLHYQNSLGTDLVVGLPEGHYWAGGGETAACNGLEFLANLPTEEVFTLPHRERVNGRVYGSMPLVDSGNIIRDFWFELKDGKIVEVHASEGEQYLRDAVSVDEGAAFLGEVALVPFNSPIRNTGILFYETLFDENAACHFAFGEAYPLFTDADSLSREEQKARGSNQSLTHVDFMIGTADLSITGTTKDGRKIPVFRNGDFVL